MRLMRWVCIGALATAVPGYAQGIKPMTERLPEPVSLGLSPGTVRNSSGDCHVFLWGQPVRNWQGTMKAGPAADPANALSACILTNTNAAREAAESPNTDTLVLVKRHVNYKKFKAWVNRAVSDLGKRPQQPAEAARWDAASPRVFKLEEDLEALRAAVHDALDAYGLNDPLTAMIFTGASFSDANGVQAEGEGAPEATSATEPEGSPLGPAAHVVFESPHFGDDEGSWLHFAFGGRVGYQQIMSMVKPVSGDDAAAVDPTPVAEYRDGLLWSVGATAYTLSRGASEAFVRVSVGGTRIGDARSVLEAENGQGFIAVPVENGQPLSAPRYEIGLGWNYYGKAMEIAHLEKGLMNPAFSAFLMHRRDKRLKGEGDLATFSSPEERWVYGISVNLRNLVKSDRGETTPTRANTFDFGFSVEREFAHGSGLKIPDSTRYVLRGEINVLRALAGRSEKQPAPADGKR